MGTWLEEEDKAVVARRKAAGEEDQGPERWGLAFSGGGIRSATFCLGLTKALAKNGLLSRFDYLSTVSGGGYAGSALGRLIQSYGEAAAKAGSHPQVPVMAQLEGELREDNRIFWWWLRKNGRYLFPAGARDTLFAAGTMLRGLTAIYFDLFLLGVLLACAIVLPHVLLMHAPRHVYQFIQWAPSVWGVAAAILPALLLTTTWAYWFSAPANLLKVHWNALLFVLASAFVTWALWDPIAVRSILTGTADATAGCKLVARLDTVFEAVAELACLTGSARLALLELMLAIPLAFVLALWVARGNADLNLARNRITRWMMRALALSLFVIVAALLDVGSWWIAGQIKRGWGAFAAGGSGMLALIVVGRALLKWLKDSAVAGGSPNMLRLAKAAGVILAFLFLLFCCSFVQVVVFYGGGFLEGRPIDNDPEIVASQSMTRWLLLFVPAAVYVLLTGGNLSSLNGSSLHNFYRARLTRSYVSVGNANRGFTPHAMEKTTPSSIAGLKRVSDVRPGDDVELKDYQPHKQGGPVHLLNVCVNQTKDDRTGEFNRDRNGRNMTVSHFGFDLGSNEERMTLDFAEGNQPTLGQWVAISGAAAAPGMGSNTSKGLAALLTLCGVRLGYWLDIAAKDGKNLPALNPLRKYFRLVNEMLATFPGSMQRYWYVSDGGHFENTGVYALLKRKVQRIVVADCGADPNYTFADLNNLVRLARIDFNAQITFLGVKEAGKEPPVPLLHFGTLKDVASPDSTSYLVLARIVYADKTTGHMLILKPALIHTLPLDLLAYKSSNPTFPQQTTADQFFDEAQWESYFRLGEELGGSISEKLLDELPKLDPYFDPQSGTGLAALNVKAPKGEARGKPQFAGEVVKSSLGIGAVAGLLITLWQALDQARLESAAESRRRAEAVARAIEKSVDPAGDVHLSDSAGLYLLTTIKAGDVERADADSEYSAARRLVVRLQAKCEKVGEDEYKEACEDLRTVAGRFQRQREQSEVVYWAGSAIDKEGTDAAEKAAADAKAKAARTAQATAKSGAAPPPVPQQQAQAQSAQKALTTAAVDACKPSGGVGARLFSHVYDERERKILNDARKDERYIKLREQVYLAPVENVVVTAERTGTAPPKQWRKTTLLYHYDAQRRCAEQLAALYLEVFDVAPVLRPLPEHLSKRPGVIELWVPPGGATKPPEPPMR